MRDFLDSFKVRAVLTVGVMVGLYLLLAPRRTQTAVYDAGTIEITYMSPSGPIQDAMEEAVREFEYLSRKRHEETGGVYPLYKVVAGQSASANQTEDPTRFLLSLVGGEPPDVIFF